MLSVARHIYSEQAAVWLLHFHFFSTLTLDLLDTLQSIIESTDGTGLAGTPFIFRQTLFHFLDHHHHEVFVRLAPIQLITVKPKLDLAGDFWYRSFFSLSQNHSLNYHYMGLASDSQNIRKRPNVHSLLFAVVSCRLLCYLTISPLTFLLSNSSTLRMAKASQPNC